MSEVIAIRPRDLARYREIRARLAAYQRDVQSLPGIEANRIRDTLIGQVLESERRIRYVAAQRQREPSRARQDPSSEMFDPLLAAERCRRDGQVDEAFWLVFLFVHFGKNAREGWRGLRDVYGRLGRGRWDWTAVIAAPQLFRDWLHDNQDELRHGGPARAFGNHRKYESLDARSARGTGAAVQSYVEWVAPPRTHDELVVAHLADAGGDGRCAFRSLFRSMSSVASFGRTARFDYLCMLGKMGLAQIEPDSPYIGGSTGPIDGARLLFDNSVDGLHSPAELNTLVVQFANAIGIGMQAVEDSLCNWQKSPMRFRRFRG